ncbi:hypothetical protein Btru_019016 [Bulinus truncatus]|nr:hypothetical protein Btru_019016 [Bulinus truncatus]
MVLFAGCICRVERLDLKNKVNFSRSFLKVYSVYVPLKLKRSYLCQFIPISHNSGRFIQVSWYITHSLPEEDAFISHRLVDSLSLQVRYFPLAYRLVDFPLAYRLVDFPLAYRLVDFPLAYRLVDFPLAYRLVDFPLAYRLVDFPLAYRHYSRRWYENLPPPNNIQPYKGLVFVLVSRGFVDYILHNPVAQKLLDWVSHTDFPDESYFSTLNHNPHLAVPGSYKAELILYASSIAELILYASITELILYASSIAELILYASSIAELILYASSIAELILYASSIAELILYASSIAELILYASSHPETNADSKPYIARFVNWGVGWIDSQGRYPFYWPCGGKRVRRVCIFGVKDLELLVNRRELFANKFILDFEPLALDCLEEWHFNMTLAEYAGKLTIDTSWYQNLDIVRNKVL